MSGANRNAIMLRQFKSALDLWPRDALRPDTQLPAILVKRLETKNLASSPKSVKQHPSLRDDAQWRQLNALYSLVENRYSKKYGFKGQLMEPRAMPTYYKDLLTELEEVPHRTWFQRIVKRVSGMVRLRD